MSMPIEKRGGYTVGRGKPPEESRFKKGQSGNPKGRPRGSVNVQDLIRRVLTELIPLKENGRIRKVTAIEAAVIKVRHLAISQGDRAALAQLLQWATDIDIAPDRSEDSGARMFAEIIKRMDEHTAMEFKRAFREASEALSKKID